MAQADSKEINSAASSHRSPDTLSILLRRLLDVTPTLIIFAVIVALWQFYVVVGNVSPAVLPSPAETVATMVESAALLLHNTWPTLIYSVVGLLVSIAIGVPLGIMLAGRGLLSRAMFPLVLSTQTIPKIALAPLLVIWLGFGAMPKIVLCILVTFFPIIITTVDGIRSMPNEMRELAAICKMSRIVRLRRMELPYALPSILSGIKVAATLSLIAALVSEFVSSNVGLGSLITQAQSSVNTQLIFAAIVVVSLLGAVLYIAVVVVEKLLIPWHTSQRIKE